jgi:hypothetical protein
MGYAGRWYYNDTQIRMNQLRENNTKLELTAKTNEETINRLQEDAKIFEIATTELNQRMNAAEVYQDELIQKLRTHNLTVLTLQKPDLIETRVNNATAKLFDDLEALTSQ